VICEMGFRVLLRSNNSFRLMSALGQKQTLRHVPTMSALPPKADIAKVEEHSLPKVFLCRDDAGTPSRGDTAGAIRAHGERRTFYMASGIELLDIRSWRVLANLRPNL
jgi:hypothetical protein